MVKYVSLLFRDHHVKNIFAVIIGDVDVTIVAIISFGVMLRAAPGDAAIVDTKCSMFMFIIKCCQ